MARDLAGAISRRAEWFHLTPDSTEEFDLDRSGKDSWWLSPMPAGLFDHVVFAPPFRSYRGPFAADIIARAMLPLKFGGMVWFPREIDAHRLDAPRIGSNWLCELMAAEPDVIGRKFQGWRRRNWSRLPASPYSIVQQMIDEQLLPSLSRSLEIPLGSHVRGVPADPIGKSWLSYSVLGMGYKASGLAIIIERYASAQSHLRLLSVGGGIGLTEMELLASMPALNSVVNLDPDARAALMAATIFAECKRSSIIPRRKSFETRVEPVEDAVLDNDDFDIVMMLGSLYTLRREVRREVLDALWECVRPGGVLIVLENIKSSRYRNSMDFDLMFTDSEIDQLLNEYGSQEFIDAIDLEILDSQDRADRTCFRVLSKRP